MRELNNIMSERESKDFGTIDCSLKTHPIMLTYKVSGWRAASYAVECVQSIKTIKAIALEKVKRSNHICTCI